MESFMEAMLDLNTSSNYTYTMDTNKTFLRNASEIDDCNQPAANLTADDLALKTMDMVLIEIVQPIFIVFGILGNIINIIVLTRRWMYSSTNCYLTALAVYDMMYLIIVPTLSFESTSVFKNSLGKTYFEYTAYGRPISDALSNTTVWLTVVFTVERYIAVSHPMRGHVLCTPKRARWVILATCLLVFLLIIPEFFEYTAVLHCGSYVLGRTEFAKAEDYSLGYNWGVIVLLFTIVPLVLLGIFNSFLVNSVWRASQMRRELSNTHEERRNKDQQKITIMLIAVVLVFFCLHTPNAIALLYISYNQARNEDWPTSQTEYNQIMRLYKSVNFLALVNSTINFVLYSSLSTKYRRTFKKIFMPCCAKHRAYNFTMASFHRQTTRKHKPKNGEAQSSQLLPNGSKAAKTGRKHPKEQNGNVAKLTDSESSTQESMDYLTSV